MANGLVLLRSAKGFVEVPPSPEGLQAFARLASCPQDFWSAAHELGAMYSEDGYEQYDSYVFMDRVNAGQSPTTAIVDRDTLRVELV